ncbi:hypothetical protein ABEI22_19415 [Erwinia billingiae]
MDFIFDVVSALCEGSEIMPYLMGAALAGAAIVAHLLFRLCRATLTH